MYIERNYTVTEHDKRMCCCKCTGLLVLCTVFWLCAVYWSSSCRYSVNATIIQANNNNILINTCNITMKFDISKTTCFVNSIYPIQCPIISSDTKVPICYKDCNNYKASFDSDHNYNPATFYISIFFLILCSLSLLYSLYTCIQGFIESQQNVQIPIQQQNIEIGYPCLGSQGSSNSQCNQNNGRSAI